MKIRLDKKRRIKDPQVKKKCEVRVRERSVFTLTKLPHSHTHTPELATKDTKDTKGTKKINSPKIFIIKRNSRIHVLWFMVHDSFTKGD